MSIGQLLEEAGLLEARGRLDGGVQGLDLRVAHGLAVGERHLALAAHRDLVPLAALAGHLMGGGRGMSVFFLFIVNRSLKSSVRLLVLVKLCREYWSSNSKDEG